MKRTVGNFLSQSCRTFPVDCELFAHAMQDNQSLLAIIGNIAGDKAILQGCALLNSNTERAAGYVFLRTTEYPQGEIMYFEGGAVQSGMHVAKVNETVVSNDKEFIDAYTVRSLVAGAGTENYSWNDFHDVKNVQELETLCTALQTQLNDLQPTPVGSVIMWAGAVTAAAIPEHYKLCDGTALKASDYPALYAALGDLHKTSAIAGCFNLPDLRSRFIVGYNNSDVDYNAVAKKGGEKKHKLLISEMPSHSHGQFLWAGASGDWRGGGNNSYPNATSLHDRTTPFGNTSLIGGGSEHENRPPYYTLAFLIKVQ